MFLLQLSLTFLITVNISAIRCRRTPSVANDDNAPQFMYLTHYDDVLSAQDDNLRLKRVITNAAKGIAALDKLLEGSTQLAPRSMRQNWFEKSGDFGAALEDFFSVRPQNVKIYSGHVTDGKHRVTKGKKTLDGKVGDRRIILKSDGMQANPVLEVIDGNSSGGPHVDIIIYKKNR